jgi:hypothetical protein
MRRLRLGLLILAAGVGTAGVAFAAAAGAPAEPPPSLEYKPPKVVVPEPKAPHPLPPLTVFRDIIGRFGMLGGAFDRPTDIAKPLANGGFLVLDVGNNRIQAFTASGDFSGSCGGRGIQDGEFDKPTAIAIPPFGADPAAAVFVVDAGNNRIQICNFSGDWTLTSGKVNKVCHCNSWGTRGSGRPTSRGPQLKSPQDIAVSSTGVVAVLDSGNDRVQFFEYSDPLLSPDGLRQLNIWDSSAGVSGGTFTGLTSLAWSDERQGYLYVLGAGCVVQQFQPDPPRAGFQGKLINSWSAIPAESGICVPARIEVDARFHYVYVLDSGNSQLSSYNPDGLYRWTLNGAQQPFDKPLGFAMDDRGEEFLVADTENNCVQKFTLR